MVLILNKAPNRLPVSRHDNRCALPLSASQTKDRVALPKDLGQNHSAIWCDEAILKDKIEEIFYAHAQCFH